MYNCSSHRNPINNIKKNEESNNIGNDDPKTVVQYFFFFFLLYEINFLVLFWNNCNITLQKEFVEVLQ